jgi:hypothetical protein
MRRQARQQLKGRQDASAVTTARHMADAVDFLTQVAREAGLRGIALKLARIRSNLLTVAAADRATRHSVRTTIAKDKRHAQRKAS